MSRRDTVLLVANYASDVGYAWWLMENFWAVIGHEMAKRGRRCVLAYPVIGTVPDVIREAPIEIIHARLRPTSWSDAVRSTRLMRRLQVRSVYLSDWPSVSFVYVMWRLAGVKSIVLHYHTFDDVPDPTGPRAWVKYAVHRVRSVSCDMYVGVCDYINQRFIENWKVPAGRCISVTNGIHTFACDTVDRSSVREHLSIPLEAVVIVLIGRASIHKGWEFALRCLRALLSNSDDLPLVHFVYCGDGPDLEMFRQTATELGLDSCVHFLGRRSDVRRILCACDIAFHPSRSETLCLSILEFMCAGLPVVVPDIRSICQTIKHRVSGMVYKANDCDAAVSVIRELVSDATLRQKLGCAARHDVLKNYRIEQTNEALARNVVPRL